GRPCAMRASAHDVLAQLDALDEVGAGVEMKKRHQPLVESHCVVIPARSREAEQCLSLAWKRIRQAGNPADGADHDALQHDIVESRKEHEAIPDHVAKVGETTRVARRLLHTTDG